MRSWRALFAVFGALALAFWLGLGGIKAPVETQAMGRVAEQGSDEITLAQLPPEGRDTLVLITQGGPFPYAKDGTVFQNREGRLPSQGRGYYREFTVPTPGASNRGARRIVAGGNGVGREYWYTADHYRTFKRIRE